jgi:GntR family transcriptional repressor for pyruvate dehydrogenase complex
MWSNIPDEAGFSVMSIKPYSLTHQVAEEVSRMILAGGLRPGERLPPMAELETRLGVSHTVMREALRMLETRGLIQVLHGKGVIVSPSSVAALSVSLNAVFRLHNGTLHHLMECRTMMETGAAGLAAVRRTDDDLREMEGCLQSMEEMPESPRGYVDADVAFHNALVAATRNPVLMSLTGSLQSLLIESRVVSFRGPPAGITRALKAHRRIFETIAAADPEAAAAAMRQHLQETLEDIEVAIAEGRLKQKL